MEQRKEEVLVLLYDEFFSYSSVSNASSLATLFQFNQSPPLRYSPVLLEDDQHIRVPLFYELWVDQYIDFDFYKLFRMKRATFAELLVLLQNEGGLENPRRKGRNIVLPIQAGKALLISLWYLGKNETLISLSERFNICEKSCHHAVWKIMNLMCDLKHVMIQWPTENECAIIERNFRDKAGYPGVIGAVGGCHFEAKIPKEQHDSYQNRKFRHFVSMQAMCLSNMKIISASIGYPGSLHDARILRESDIARYIERYNPDRFFYNKYHLLGDSAYPCQSWLLTPYRNYGDLTAAQRRYNYCHSRTRICIENTFGHLKGRWRKLQYIYVFSVIRVTKIITACCFLHNFCISQNDIFDEVYEEEGHEQPLPYQDAEEGIQKREIICNLLIGNQE